MDRKEWKISKIRYCEHVGHEIALETQVVYPAEHLPEQMPRVLARRCSNAIECNKLDKMVCAWCGTNPNLTPT